MNLPETQRPAVEPDTRFPSGPWTGFFLQAGLPGRQWMELDLRFLNGAIRGEGRDRVGPFLVRGKYTLDDGKCWWNKAYLGKHDIAYQGYNEGQGIWGLWEYDATWKGGFHIWPVAMGDPTRARLEAAADEPAPAVFSADPAEAPGSLAEVGQPVASEVGGPFGGTIRDDDLPAD